LAKEDVRMTAGDLNRIEAALDLKLPVFYREAMLNYPQWLAEKQPAWSNVTHWDFADDPDRVIHFNQYVRGFRSGEFFDDEPWPPHYFVIGSEEEQNWYFLNLAGGSEAVFLYHHDRGEVRQLASSLQEFPDALVEWWQEVESMQ
jgi:hypothetical protein